MGEAFFNPKVILTALVACILGSIFYRLAIAIALNASFLGLQAQDLQLVTAVIVGLAMVTPKLRAKILDFKASRSPSMIRLLIFMLPLIVERPWKQGPCVALPLNIKKGDFVCVIGGNGAGKSTVLNALCGDILPERGTISIDNQDVTTLTSWQRAPYVARVFQDPMAGTCANLTIEENMALAMGRGEKRTLKLALNKEHREKFRFQLSRLKAWP